MKPKISRGNSSIKIKPDGYKTIQEKVNKAKAEYWYRNKQFDLALEKDK